MNKFDQQFTKLIGSMDREWRLPVAEAFRDSDGTVSGFEQELRAQIWDHPDLPVEDIMHQLTSN